MNLKRYEYSISNNFHEYWFYSEGPKGTIRKMVVYDKINDDPLIFNLAFGDEDPGTGKINDITNSNNGDRDIVLATVANTINTFSDHCNNPIIFVKGSTPSRTRLYQMGISGLWEEVRAYFNILGFKENEWHTFRTNVNYESFFVKKR